MAKNNNVAKGNEEELADNPKLETPCKVSIERPRSLWGAIVHVFVYLNDKQVGKLKNGKTIAFSTDQEYNEIKIGNPANNSLVQTLILNETALAGHAKFKAVSGGTVQFVYYYMKGKLAQI